MSTYAIHQHPDRQEYEVHIVGPDGVRQTVLGFATEADAEEWISADKARDQPPAPE